MSACIEVKQNPDGSWTASGSYGGVFASTTAQHRYQAVAAVDRALHAFDQKPATNASDAEGGKV